VTFICWGIAYNIKMIFQTSQTDVPELVKKFELDFFCIMEILVIWTYYLWLYFQLKLYFSLTFFLQSTQWLSKWSFDHHILSLIDYFNLVLSLNNTAYFSLLILTSHIPFNPMININMMLDCRLWLPLLNHQIPY